MDLIEKEISGNGFEVLIELEVIDWDELNNEQIPIIDWDELNNGEIPIEAEVNFTARDTNDSPFNTKEIEEARTDGTKIVVLSDIDNQEAIQQKQPMQPEVSSEPENVIAEKKKLTRKRQRKTKLWKSNIRKRLHQTGQEYFNARGKKIAARSVQGACAKSCRFKCASSISVDQQQSIFNTYYSLHMDTYAKKMFILYNTDKQLTARPKAQRDANDDDARRQFSFKYFFHVNDVKIRVCKRFFLGTLNISQKPVYNAHTGKSDYNTPKADMRGKSDKCSIKRPVEQTDTIRKHILSFPLVQSHYCRAGSQKHYLEPGLNISKMYDLYVIFAEENDFTPEKKSMYYHIFNTEFNISFHVPKKDRCDKCEVFKASEERGDTTSEQRLAAVNHKEHNKINKAERQKDRDGKIPTLLFDMENVMLCPKANIGSFFYKSKMNFYNLTAWLSTTKTKYCAVWPETLSGRCGDDIASAFRKIVDTVLDENDISELITWSDSCVNQNRNSMMASSVIQLMSKNHEVQAITMKYSTPGHSRVQEVDNIHSQIENGLKDQEYFSPLGLIRLLKKSNRKNPLRILQMTASDFKDFSTSTREFSFKDVPFTQLTSLRFTQNLHEISYQINFNTPLINVNLNKKERKSRKSTVVKYKTTTLYPVKDELLEHEIPHSSIQLIKEIGGGAFGTVFLARGIDICGKLGHQNVAVKQLKKRPTEEDTDEFFHEIQTMKVVKRHPNVVAILGFCTVKEPLQIVMEYVSCGDLLSYLRKVRAKHEERYPRQRLINQCEPDHPLLPPTFGKYLDLMNSSTTSTSDSSHATDTDGNLRPSVTETMYTTLSQNQDPISSSRNSLEYLLDHKELHDFATQIAKGMTHLHELKITHRDLAARNILIDENKVLKISDFGLSRNGIYVNTKNKKVPLRWLSIEAMQDNLFSDKSDVWAFGIVLWEIGTLGAYPYHSVYNHELLPYLSSGKRLEQPENCSKYLYELMLHCWAHAADDRPTFAAILSKLEPIHQKIYVDFSELSSDYVFPPTKEQIKNNKTTTSKAAK